MGLVVGGRDGGEDKVRQLRARVGIEVQVEADEHAKGDTEARAERRAIDRVPRVEVPAGGRAACEAARAPRGSARAAYVGSEP